MKAEKKKLIFTVIISAIGGVITFISLLAVVGFLKFQSHTNIPDSSNSDDLVYESPLNDNKPSSYYGAITIYSGNDFTFSNVPVLAEGPGLINGRASSNGTPVNGLKIRFALNGSAKTKWITTDDQGNYEIKVPYGEYRISAYDIDYDTANKVLKGKIDDPNTSLSRRIIEVKKGKQGRGLDLNFVDPVSVVFPSGLIDIEKVTEIKWDPFAGAAHYHVQIIERNSPDNFKSDRWILSSDQISQVEGTVLNLMKTGVKFTPGYYYQISVTAFDKDNQILSKSIRRFSDFTIRKD